MESIVPEWSTEKNDQKELLLKHIKIWLETATELHLCHLLSISGSFSLLVMEAKLADGPHFSKCIFVLSSRMIDFIKTKISFSLSLSL